MKSISEIIRQLIIISIMEIVLLILYWAGKVSRYTGCMLDGHKLTIKEFFTRFGVNQELVIVSADQGRLCCVHGVYGGQYLIKGQIIDENEMVKNVVQDGHYILCSCVNAEHRDFEVDGKSFMRDKNSISHWETILLPMRDGELWIWGSKWVSVYTALLRKDYALAWDIAKA